jgi:hypothetical protein
MISRFGRYARSICVEPYRRAPARSRCRVQPTTRSKRMPTRLFAKSVGTSTYAPAANWQLGVRRRHAENAAGSVTLTVQGADQP